MLREMLKKKNMSIYRLAKTSGLPYATVNDLCNEKVQLQKCSAQTVYQIAHALGMPMEELLTPYLAKRSSFENFKSSVCHRVREMGDLAFAADVLERGEIRTYYNRKWYPESLYLLAMLDYISRENNIPLCRDYDDLRKCRLKERLYPAGINALCGAAKNDFAREEAVKAAIPEFLRFNIVEAEVRDVI